MEAKTIVVRKANVVLNVSEDQLNFYTQRGYEVCDEFGRIRKVTEKDPAIQIKELQEELATLRSKKVPDQSEEDKDLKKENERLTNSVQELREQNRTLKKQLREAEKRLQHYE